MTRTGSHFNGVALAAALLLVACAEPATPLEVEPVQSAPAAVIEAPVAAPIEAPASEAAIPATAQLNPAHGQPGHDCAIPVGAPLDGSTPTTGPAMMPVPAATPVTTPVTSPALGTGRINPAHGEPGHDCAVPVGSPLPG